jgi:hypothetical protein
MVGRGGRPGRPGHTLVSMSEANAITGFLPSRQGFHFANRFPTGPTLKIGPLDPRWVGIGDASAGLCGGMAWYVRERFDAGRAIPPDTEAPANGSPLFRAIVRSQVRSLRWFLTTLWFWWAGVIGPERSLETTRERVWPGIRRAIDAGRLPLVGLVRHHGSSPWAMTDSHQVLAYAYDLSGDVMTLRIYDPNWPDRDDVTLTVDATGIRQSTGEPLFGLLLLDQGEGRSS